MPLIRKIFVGLKSYVQKKSYIRLSLQPQNIEGCYFNGTRDLGKFTWSTGRRMQLVPYGAGSSLLVLHAFQEALADRVEYRAILFGGNLKYPFMPELTSASQLEAITVAYVNSLKALGVTHATVQLTGSRDLFSPEKQIHMIPDKNIDYQEITPETDIDSWVVIRAQD